MNQDGRGDPVNPSVSTRGNEGEERIVIMRLCSCTTGMSYRSELVPFPASYEDAMLDAITVFLDTLPPNTIPADIEIKYAYKCADGTGGWAGLSSTKGSPEKWRQALKANTCELGVFHISSIATENIRREFPYSSQMSQDATVTDATRMRVSVKFNAEQVVFDAPPTLEECIAAVNFAFKTHVQEEDARLAYFERRQDKPAWPREIKLYPHSAHGRSNKELGTEEYKKMTIQSPTIIYLEAKYELK